MAVATETKRDLITVSVYECSDCNEVTLAEVSIPGYCQHCGEEFEETELLDDDV